MIEIPHPGFSVFFDFRSSRKAASLRKGIADVHNLHGLVTELGLNLLITGQVRRGLRQYGVRSPKLRQIRHHFILVFVGEPMKVPRERCPHKIYPAAPAVLISNNHRLPALESMALKALRKIGPAIFSFWEQLRAHII